MGFKQMTQFVAEKNKDFFVLPDDGNMADVIFLYHSINDVLIAPAHWVKSGNTSGYFFCCEDGCPACAKNIRVQDKLFIPLYNITTGKIEVWDRGFRFKDQLIRDVFTAYADPSQYVFRIVRHGQANSVDTTYSITAVNTNSTLSVESILGNAHTTIDQVYELAIKEITPFEMKAMLDASDTQAANNTAVQYNATPRGNSTFTAPPQIAQPDVIVDTPTVTPPEIGQGPTTDIPMPEPPAAPEANGDFMNIPDIPDSVDGEDDDLGDVHF